MTMISYAGHDDGTGVEESTEELLARREAERVEALELENERLRNQLKSLQGVLGCVAKVVQPYYVARQLARQR